MNDNDHIRTLQGMMSAFSIALQVLMHTHPDREALRNAWATLMPEAADAFEQLTHPSPIIPQAFREAMAHLAASAAQTERIDDAEMLAKQLIQALRLNRGPAA